MYVLLVTDVRTSGFDQRVFGPFETEDAARAATLHMPVVRSRTRKVLRVLDPMILAEPASDPYASDEA